MSKQFFGTDGIRGKVGEEPITAEFMLRLGWAAGKVFSREGKCRVIIGKDTRISGYMFESALEAGLSSAGADVSLLGPMPTPAIAYLTRTFKAHAGIVISASHNPYFDNGIKFFSSLGEKLEDEVEIEIEDQMSQSMQMVESDRIGKVDRIEDAAGRYIEFCKSTFPAGFSLGNHRVVLDCANGATYHVAPSVFRELGAEVTELGVTPDGLNINDGVGSTRPERLQARVLEEKADYGIALDGDGDRVIMVNHLGELVDGDALLWILAKDMKARDQLVGGVVGTLMSNLGLELALGEIDVPFVRASVGDRHVLLELSRREWLIGGESSGHILCRHLTSTGDGIIAALQIVAAMESQQASLKELVAGMASFPQTMINVGCKDTLNLGGDAVLQKAIAAVEEKLAGRGRVLLRPSGTEPVVRVMVEGEDGPLVQRLAGELAQVVEARIGDA